MIKQEKTKEETIRDNEIERITFNAFNESYGELYNLLDLIFDGYKADSAKGLIGGIFHRTKTGCRDWIIDYLYNDNKL